MTICFSGGENTDTTGYSVPFPFEPQTHQWQSKYSSKSLKVSMSGCAGGADGQGKSSPDPQRQQPQEWGLQGIAQPGMPSILRHGKAPLTDELN